VLIFGGVSLPKTSIRSEQKLPMSSSLSRRGACIAAAAVACLLLLAAASGAAAQDTKSSVAPAHGSSSSKHGCTSIDGCKSCSKSGCTACKTGANLRGGQCYCPAGTGQYGTANTEQPVTGRRKLSAQANKPAHGGSKGGKKGGGGGGGGGSGASSFACAPCDANSYSAADQLVGSARCVVCPAGMQASLDRTTCLVPPGFYYDPSSGQVVVCPGKLCVED
jgi:hypothetical protein